MKKRVFLWSAVAASALLLAGCCCCPGNKPCARTKKMCKQNKHWHKVQCNTANCNAPDEVETVTIEAVGIIPPAESAPAAPAATNHAPASAATAPATATPAK